MDLPFGALRARASSRREGVEAIGAFLLAAVLDWVQAPAALIVLIAVLGAGLIVVAWTAPREDRSNAAGLVADVQGELVAVIEDGKSLSPDIFRPPHFRGRAEAPRQLGSHGRPR
jgi:hypothetical protein